MTRHVCEIIRTSINEDSSIHTGKSRDTESYTSPKDVNTQRDLQTNKTWLHASLVT